MPTTEAALTIIFFENEDWSPNIKHTHSSTERQHLGPIPFSDVAEVYVFQMEEFIPAHFEIWNELGTLKTGSRNTPDVKGTWKRII